MQQSPSRISPFALAALAVALVGLVGLVTSGLGTRWGWWHFRSGLALFRYAAYAGIAALLLGTVAALLTRPGSKRRGFSLALFAIVIAGTLAGPLQMMRKAKAVPMIHDITTDPVNPPPFRAILPLRKDADNPPEHPGAETIAQQKQAYPDIAPLELRLSPASAQAKAVKVAYTLGWDIVASDPNSGIIEAVDTTPFFGFKDDIVIRLTPHGNGTRIDVRSKSRVGKSDVGKNAERIRKFLERMRDPA